MSKYIYLAGPITGVDTAADWRKLACQLLEPHGLSGIDPLVVEAKTITPEQVVQLDYAWIERSSGIIARVDQPSWGTAMELVYAHGFKMPIIGWGNIEKPSPWLFHHLTKHVPYLGEAVALIKELVA